MKVYVIKLFKIQSTSFLTSASTYYGPNEPDFHVKKRQVERKKEASTQIHTSPDTKEGAEDDNVQEVFRNR